MYTPQILSWRRSFASGDERDFKNPKDGGKGPAKASTRPGAKLEGCPSTQIAGGYKPHPVSIDVKQVEVVPRDRCGCLFQARWLVVPEKEGTQASFHGPFLMTSNTFSSSLLKTKLSAKNSRNVLYVRTWAVRVVVNCTHVSKSARFWIVGHHFSSFFKFIPTLVRIKLIKPLTLLYWDCALSRPS